MGLLLDNRMKKWDNSYCNAKAFTLCKWLLAQCKISGGFSMNAVITVLGKDNVGILANVSSECAKVGVNIIEVTQSILQGMFAMIMFVDITACTVPFSELVDSLTAKGEEMGVKIHVMHEDIFNAMHKI